MIAEKPARGEPRKTGISRFSAEELMICNLKATTPEGAIRELVDIISAEPEDDYSLDPLTGEKRWP